MLAEVYRIDETFISVELHTEKQVGSYRVYAHREAGFHRDAASCIGEGQGDLCKIPYPKERNEAHFFSIECETGEQVSAGFRILPIAGMYNFRDMGGYSGLDGRKVAWGKLYRGDHLYNMKEEGIPLFDSLGIRSIVDFRSEKEGERYPNKTGQKEIAQYHFVPEGKIAALAGSLQNGEEMGREDGGMSFAREMVKKDPDFSIKSMVNQQIEFVHHPDSRKAFGDLLRLMAEPGSEPLYFHCKGGKDRTGYAAMLLLDLLGVSKQQIMYDYLLTNRAREKKNQRYLENFRRMAGGDEQVALYMYHIFEAREEYLCAAIREIEACYGSVYAYAVQELDLTHEQIWMLRQKYLE